MKARTRAQEYRAPEQSLISSQIFLWRWCFNFQSVWVNNVWLSVPLLTLTISCLNPIVPRAWGLGSLAGVWFGAFYVYTIGQVSISPVSVNSRLNWSIKGCRQMKTLKDGKKALWKSPLLLHFIESTHSLLLPTEIWIQLNKRRKVTWEEWNAVTIFLGCNVYWIPFTQSCGRFGPSSQSMPQRLLIATDIYISQGLTIIKEKTNREPLCIGLLRQAFPFSFLIPVL